VNTGQKSVWALLVLGSVFLGVGAYTFRYAEGLSYFSADPKACVNCHIMQPSFDSWQKASHHNVAKCVDCHLPHALVPKYLAKADNGYRHSKGFTFQDFHEPLRVTPRNDAILQDNCLRCHDALVHGTGLAAGRQALRCVHCHRNVGHGDKTGMGRIYSENETKGSAS
jgi:cytochrome c nitrite reductase small subunit